MKDLLDLPYQKINSSGYCLSYLYTNFPDSLKRDVLNFFLVNKYVSIRRRGYKILKEKWDKEYESQILENWNKFDDSECAKLIIDNFEITLSQEFLKEFEEALGDDWHIRKLYLKMAKHDRAILDYVKKVDEITYCYILVTLDECVSGKEAQYIYENNSNDERIGLLIWCFGKMNLWDILQEIEKDTSISSKYL